MVKRGVNAFPLMKGRSVGQPSGYGLGCVWSVDFQDLAEPELLNHVIGHAVGGISGFLVRIPHMVGNELQDELGIDGPRKQSSGRSAAPGFG
jgi:hypothetical protein